MRALPGSLVLLLAAPAAALAQRAALPQVESWLAPILADAGTQAAAALAQSRIALAQAQPTLRGLARSQAALAQAGPALARVGPTLARLGPALEQARVALSSLQFHGILDGQGSAELQVPPEPWAQQDPADPIYQAARRALNRELYVEAADRFQEIYQKHPKSSYAPDAYYWHAYALSRRGGDESLRRALEVLELQREKAPNAGTRRDAETLATRIQGQLAQNGNAEAAESISETARSATTPTPASSSRRQTRATRERCGNEDEIQTAALNALMNMDAERALPILRNVLARRDPESLCLRRKAVFLISQHSGAETERLLLNAARNDPDSEVREQAVFWLSQVDSPGATTALDSILRNASDPVLQDKAIFALSQQNSTRSRAALRDFVMRNDVSDALREKAIFWIGQTNDPEAVTFLRTAYGQLRSESLRDKILFSVSQTSSPESHRWLLQIAGNQNESIELRKKALFWAGQSSVASAELFALYETMPNKEMKEHLIFVFSQRSERAAVDKLMQIARSDADYDLRKKALFWLGQSNDPRVPDFIARLLERP